MGNLIPFNLEAFKKGQKALTRGGRVATFVGVCEECYEDCQLIVSIDGNRLPIALHLNGMRNATSVGNSDLYDLVSMVSRHQHLIDSYDPQNTYLCARDEGDLWAIVQGEPVWDESLLYRLHKHNDLIKAWKKGAKIECKHKGEKWHDASSDDIRAWHEDVTYRIKQEPEPTYPIYKQSKTSGIVVKFTGMSIGEVISSGITNYDVGKISDTWIPPEGWVDPVDKPKTKTVYEWIHEANAGNVNYFVSSWVADEDVEYFFGLDAPKQKYKTGRSLEVEV